jgi:replication factor A1
MSLGCLGWLADVCDRVRYQVQYANPLNFSVESKKLADIIAKYSISENSLFVQ